MIKDRFDRKIHEGSEVAISKSTGASSSVLITGRVLEIKEINNRTRLKIQQFDQVKATWYDFSSNRLIVID